MQKILLIITLIASLNANAVLGPIPIYLNTEYRTDSPVIGSITSTPKASVMEISHRGADFMALAQKSEQDLRDLMNIPDNYKLLALGLSCLMPLSTYFSCIVVVNFIGEGNRSNPSLYSQHRYRKHRRK
jgi:hypothetical protein